MLLFTFFPISNTQSAMIWRSAKAKASQDDQVKQVLEGVTVYSPSLDAGDNFITAAGTTLAYATNSSGAYIFGEGGMAKFVRTDIPIRNGVIHVSYRTSRGMWMGLVLILSIVD